jgi:asparagine synthase (glutamine-hydrolysing)
VAVHGYLGDWERRVRARGVDLDPAWSEARKLALAHRALDNDLFPLLRGEFALLIHDVRQHRLLALRDVVGCRPLFFEQSDGRVFLATGMPQVRAGSGSRPELFHDAVVDYLLNRPLAREETLQRPVRRILPGRVYSFSSAEPSTRPHSTEYWSPPEIRQDGSDPEELVHELRSLLRSTLDAALPDQPFAMALSGGVDSPTLWALLAERAAAGDSRAARGRPFSLVYPGQDCDERPLIEQVLRKTGATGRFIDMTGCDPLAAYPELVAVTGTMFPPTLYQFGPLFDAAGGDGRQIVLTGLGPDDWLRGNLGYIPDLLFRGRLPSALRDTFLFQLPVGLSRPGLLRRLLGQAGRRLFPRLRRDIRPRWLTRSAWQRAMAASPRYAWDRVPIPLARRALLRDLERYRSGLFLEPAAQFAASAGMELRHPLLGVDFVDFAFRSPARAFIGGQRFKHLLRLAAGDLLPGAVRDKTRRVVFDGLFLPAVRKIAEKGNTDDMECVSCGILAHREVPNFFYSNDGVGGLSSLQVVRIQIAEVYVQHFLMQ